MGANNEVVQTLPQAEFIIGARQVAKAVKTGAVRNVFIASNCPDFLLQRLADARITRFSGDQRELGTRLGKPFPVAVAGMKEEGGGE